jgi:phosphopantothenoylcysteine synthetase/decarboxylase
MKILITGGGCEEAIDGVRSLCNFSTGATAAAIAQDLACAGHEVTALMAERSRAILDREETSLRVRPFRSYADLSASLREELEAYHWDLIIHAAAVSDYGVAAVRVGDQEFPGGSLPKIDSGQEVLITLKPHDKILYRLRAWCRNPQCRIAAFKLTRDAGEDQRREAVEKLFREGIGKGPDLVIHNDLSEIQEGAHPFTVYIPAEARGSEKTPIVTIASGHTKGDLGSFFKEICA